MVLTFISDNLKHCLIKRINSITTSNYSVTPFLDYYGTKTRVEFSGSCLKQYSVTFNHKKVVNIYIVYEISKSFNISDYPTLESCLFGAVSLTKMLTLTGMDIVDMELDLIGKEDLHFLALD